MIELSEKEKEVSQHGYGAISRREALWGYGVQPKLTKAGNMELSPDEQNWLLFVLTELTERDDALENWNQVRQSHTVKIGCQECNKVVEVLADIFEGGKPISGDCPKCNGRLYFA